MTDERAIQRCETENTAVHTRVTGACIGDVLDSYWINFTGFNASNREIADNPARTRPSNCLSVG